MCQMIAIGLLIIFVIIALCKNKILQDEVDDLNQRLIPFELMPIQMNMAFYDESIRSIERRLEFMSNNERGLRNNLSQLEEYLDIENYEDTSGLSRMDYIFGAEGRNKYRDKRINKLKLLYDHLNLDIKTIEATPVQYKLVKKERSKAS